MDAQRDEEMQALVDGGNEKKPRATESTQRCSPCVLAVSCGCALNLFLIALTLQHTLHVHVSDSGVHIKWRLSHMLSNGTRPGYSLPRGVAPPPPPPGGKIDGGEVSPSGPPLPLGKLGECVALQVRLLLLLLLLLRLLLVLLLLLLLTPLPLLLLTLLLPLLLLTLPLLLLAALTVGLR